ncbi:DNA helicase [Purpureocillium takamizusanense]|uniref:DNA helicase n=1 Tax=Purpureocillium takamizusanense TaxID=2060973 RepID=A0A9Q8QCF2_9HYPO|nr:DNA helicase [Purpureocillium takamizusanense]UNI17070.1 DNA helicase [Purpureocillium takamizusanense]
MMPETASPKVQPAMADPDSSSDELSPPPDDASIEELKIGDGGFAPLTEEHADDDATPHTNGHVPAELNGHHDSSDDDSERPTKRRKTRDSTPPPTARKPKIESPPWKKIEAEGPTSYTENGRRKSGRINTLPLDLHPPGKKRLTRQSLGGRPSGTPKKDTTSASTKGSRSVPSKDKAAKKVVSTPKSASKKPVAEPRLSNRSRRRTPSPRPQPTRHSTRPRRASRLAADSDTSPINDSKFGYYDASGRSPRSRWRIVPGAIPLVHPDQVRKRPKIGTSFEDFWARAGDIPVEEGGLQASEDGPPYTDDVAFKEAQTILRIEHEVEPGGLLSRERCSLFAPEGEEEPPRQWARRDHMVKAMSNFRKLLLAEQQRHRATAKKLAEACRDEWWRRQPKSAEQVEAEERDKWILRYRVVIRALIGTWENVKAQVNQRRLEEWEAEEQRRVKAALNEAVSLSEQKLQARRELDSGMPSDEDGFDDLSDDMSGSGSDGDDDLLSDEDGQDDDDSDNMSTSDDDEGDESKDVADEGLTQEQLRAKYAHIPELGPHSPSHDDTTSADPATAETDADAAQETSDESVDMDDDLGSSDMGSDDDDDESEGGDESADESEGEAGGLLGLFFGKSELKQIQDQAPEDTTANGDDIKLDDTHVQGPDGTDKACPITNDAVDDDDAMSLVRLPESVNGDGLEDEQANGPQDEDAMTDKVDVSAKADEPITTQIRDDEDDKAHIPDQQTNGDAQRNTSPADDVAMADADQAGDPGEHTAVAEKPASPETEPVTNPASQDPSQSPATSETKPSDVDGASTVDLAVAKVGKSRSPSQPAPESHKMEVPFLLRGTLREYQRDGLDWLAGLYANNTNGILADEMGLGKTIQTIALLAHLACSHEVWGPHLVVVPTSVMLNWEMEFKKWCPGFKILAYYGSQEERKRKRQGWNNDDVWNVCITSYQLVLQDHQVFKRRRWHYMILDEAHNIKNFKSQRWRTLLGFNTQARLLLTGTPLQNNLTELWSLLFFLMPSENGVGGFADLQEFQDWFHKPESQILESGREQMDEEAKAIISKLHKVLRPYLLRRLKADVEKQMPGKYEHVEFCRLSKRQRELYDGFLSRADTKQTLASGNYMSIINCLMQLRKVCNHPDLFTDRPIMTSFRMARSVPCDYEFTERIVRHSLLATPPMAKVNLSFLNLIPTEHEQLSNARAERIAQLSSHRTLMDLREAQRSRAQSSCMTLDPSTVESTIAYLEGASRWGRFEELQHCVYLNALRRQQRPIYGESLVNLVSVEAHRRPCRPRPRVPRKIMAWFEDDSTFIRNLIPSLDQRADSFKTTIEKFSCVTPAVVTRDLERPMLGRMGVQAFTDADLKLSAPVRWAPFMPKAAPPDPWHEARMRLSIQFPDKRLLQYDCGKLQVLDKLLRRLQAGGHRALIFTQMTKVLDILEQFLNIHGHKYLRLDGATKVEQRQILTDRFNNDPRILCFILSTRSGGLGINLTGADTVIFYDQDWNPAMDKQCQDRCHRIGQTRDVHIYRLVSEHTIEANILRKASQKQMLDDVVIQEGEFTTDYFNRVSVRDVLGEKIDFTSEGVAAADAALDRVLGGPSESKDQRTVGRVLEQAEDREDVAAARIAEREIQADDADFTEKPSGPASGASTTRQGTPAKSVLDGSVLDGVDSVQLDEDVEYNAWGDRVGNIDDYMLGVMAAELEGTKLELPKDKKKSKKKKGKDTRKR